MMRRRWTGTEMAYMISRIHGMVKRASSSLEAPSSPILFPSKLTGAGKDDEKEADSEDTRTRMGILDISQRKDVGQEGLCELGGSFRADIIPLQTDREGWEKEADREETRTWVAYWISVIEVLVKRASASFEAPSSPILFPSMLTEKYDERRRRQGREAYSIWVTEVLVERASASLEAPSSPILFPSKLTEKYDERRRRQDKNRIGTRTEMAYPITAIEVLVKRAFASLEAPSGPILFPFKLTGKDDEKEEDREETRTQGHTR
jgi:hypothetical protein